MYPQNPKGFHKYAPPPLLAAPPPPMFYPSLTPSPVFPANGMPPFPFPYPYPYPYPYGNCLSPECTGKGDGIPVASPEMGMIPLPNKNGWVPPPSPSPGKGIGAHECMNGFPAAPPSPSASSVVYLQRIGTGTSDAPETAWSTSLFGCLADFKSCTSV